MKYIITLLLVGWAQLLYSQPTLTAANEATIGDAFTYVFADTTGIEPGNGGSAQIWDFSAASASGLTQVESWVAPTSTPFASSYPTADIVQQTDNGTGQNIYLYHNLTGTDTQLEGIAFDIGGMPSIMIYSNTEILRQYPATFNSTLADSYAGVSTQTTGPLTTNVFRNGTYEYLIDGYGTLITPMGNYPNTLRFKLRQVFTDSTVYSGVPIPPVVQQNISTTYFWASADAGDKLYQFYIGYDTLITTTFTTPFMSVSYQDDATGITDNMHSGCKNITAFPNPSIDNVTINIKNTVTGIAHLWIFDSNGNHVMSNQIKMNAANNFRWSFPLTGIAPGIYTARIVCGNNVWLTKIVRF